MDFQDFLEMAQEKGCVLLIGTKTRRNFKHLESGQYASVPVSNREVAEEYVERFQRWLDQI